MTMPELRGIRRAVYIYLLDNVVPLWDVPDDPIDVSAWDDVEDGK